MHVWQLLPYILNRPRLIKKNYTRRKGNACNTKVIRGVCVENLLAKIKLRDKHCTVTSPAWLPEGAVWSAGAGQHKVPSLWIAVRPGLLRELLRVARRHCRRRARSADSPTLSAVQMEDSTCLRKRRNAEVTAEPKERSEETMKVSVRNNSAGQYPNARRYWWRYYLRVL